MASRVKVKPAGTLAAVLLGGTAIYQGVCVCVCVFSPHPGVIYFILIQHVCFGALYVFSHETLIE